MVDRGGRPNLIEDFLITLHTGGWYDWTDPYNKVYSNLRLTDKIWDSSYQGKIHEEGMIVNPYSLPTEQECIDGLAQLQTDFDALDYVRKRQDEYPTVQELVVALYDTEDKAAIDTKRAEIKLKYPKP
jgi:hypothetical protein